jgi:flavin-binding protein dodecin
VEGAWIKEQKVIVKDGEVSEYRVTMKVTFVLDD